MQPNKQFLPYCLQPLLAAAILFCCTTLSAQQQPAPPAMPTHTEQITVTAYGTPLASDDSAANTLVVTEQSLQESPALTTGDTLREAPGVQFFRRTSTIIANPTSQGLSLRGLGSTASSRTLVLSDHIPLNDAFGGWIHWEEFPAPVLQSVEILRGGASDLYGSSAIGGVINFIQRAPQVNNQTDNFMLNINYGSQNTRSVSLLGSAQRGPWSGLASTEFLRTDGYTLVAPGLRGSVDQPYNAHLYKGLLEIYRGVSTSDTIFLRGSVDSDIRGNGTPLQTNGMHLWRYAAGADLPLPYTQHLMLRLYGSEQHYRQSFSTVATNRDSEALNRLLQTPTQELGAAAQWSVLLRHLTLLAGADVHDVRGTDMEVPILNSLTNGLSDTSDRQRDAGFYGEALLHLQAWTLSAGGRIDLFHNFDTQRYTQTGSSAIVPSTLAGFSEVVADPRAGIVRRISPWLSLMGSGFRAYRSPTMYELYRTGQVGQETTLANSSLLSERATGWEAGTQLSSNSHHAFVRASYFWNVVNRPITALTLNTTATTITKQRENLGQIRSQGVLLDFEFAVRTWATLTGGYQYADAIVTQNSPQPQLVGTWIPEVPHQSASATLRMQLDKKSSISLTEVANGHQFDDDDNTYLLHSFFRTDAHAERTLRHGIVFQLSGENLFDRTIEAGRTPILTLASRRVVSGGIRINLSK